MAADRIAAIDLAGENIVFVAIARITDGTIVARLTRGKTAKNTKKHFLVALDRMLSKPDFAQRAEVGKRFSLESQEPLPYLCNFTADKKHNVFIVYTEKHYKTTLVFKLIAELKDHFYRHYEDAAKTCKANGLSPSMKNYLKELTEKYDSDDMDKIRKVDQFAATMHAADSARSALNAQIEACLVQTTGIGEALVSNTTATKDLADDYSTSAKKSMWIQNRKGTILTVIIVAIIVSAVVILAIIIFVSTKPWLWIGRNNNNNNNNNNDDDDDDTRRRLLENLLPWR